MWPPRLSILSIRFGTPLRLLRRAEGCFQFYRLDSVFLQVRDELYRVMLSILSIRFTTENVLSVLEEMHDTFNSID